MLLPPASRAVFGAIFSKSEAHPDDAADGSIAAEAIPLRERARKAMVVVAGVKAGLLVLLPQKVVGSHPTRIPTQQEACGFLWWRAPQARLDQSEVAVRERACQCWKLSVVATWAD